MSYPPPPGLPTSQAHPSLPARPPTAVTTSSGFTSAFSHSTPGAPSGGAATAYGGFAGFKPRNVGAASQGWQAHSSTVSAGPQPPTTYPGAQSHYAADHQQNMYQQQPQHYQTPGMDAYNQSAAPQIRNPFAAPVHSSAKDRFGLEQFDPEMEAQIAQWQSAYSSTPDTSKIGGSGGYGGTGNANTLPLGVRGGASAPLSNHEVAAAAKSTDTAVASVVAGADGKQKTVVRSGGGKTWQDPSLLEWDPAHFRLFVGNLAGEVTDESLLKAFSRYESVQKARVVRDKRTTKSRGFGFVSFSNGDQYFQAAKEMEGKYIGSHPVQLRRSTTEIKATVPKDNRKHHKGGKGGGGGGNADTGAGVQKKPTKTKGGLRILG